jgi:hypothetical protein
MTLAPGITVLIPAYRAQATIARAAQRLSAGAKYLLYADAAQKMD